MDLPYDQTQEDAFGQNPPEQKASLEEDLQVAYKAFSASPWGAKIGGFLGNVVKQGGTVYNEASQEFAAIGQDATKGLSGLRNTIISHTRSLSSNNAGPSSSRDATDDKDGQTTPTRERQRGTTDEHEAGVLDKLREEAAKRLKDIQKAEDAADEALLKFGASVRNFLQGAISIAPPEEVGSEGEAARGGGGMRFESKDAQGKRVIHASRYDAQLHVVHTSTDSLRADPEGDEFVAWAKGFDVGDKTEDISADLTAYPELRTTMEALVPDQVPYADFWRRYYFLRHGIETAEARRRDLLKAASADDDVKWDDDSDDDESGGDEEKAATATAKTVIKKDETAVKKADDESDDSDEDDDSEDDDETDNEALAKAAPKDAKRRSSESSSTTLNPKPAAAPRPEHKSTDAKSVADSEASYDLVGAASGAPSRTSGSPKAGKEESDDSEDDWE